MNIKTLPLVCPISIFSQIHFLHFCKTNGQVTVAVSFLCSSTHLQVCNHPHKSHGIGDPGSRTRLLNYQAFTFSQISTKLYTHFILKVYERSMCMKICINIDFVPLQFITEQLGIFFSSVILILFFVLFLIF